MNQTVAKLINEQINKEFYSAYLYLDFANYYAQVGTEQAQRVVHLLVSFLVDHGVVLLSYLALPLFNSSISELCKNNCCICNIVVPGGSNIGKGAPRAFSLPLR